jgi:biopolymer transport protein ExbB
MNGQEHVRADVFFLYSISNVRAVSAFDLDNTIQTLVQRLGPQGSRNDQIERQLSQSHSLLGRGMMRFFLRIAWITALAMMPCAASAQVASPPVGTAGMRELSPWSMFMSADILVKAVMVSLAFASLVTWTIFLGKTLQLLIARRRVKSDLARIAQTRTLSEAQLAFGKSGNVVATLLSAAITELRMSTDTLAEGGVRERAESRFTEILRAENRVARIGMGLLATIGSTSPFVGLFGTVWGIMNSFIGISKAQTTNLAVVAPGIAEALLATAIGLVAAIPAVIFYNHFARGSKGYLELVSRASGAVGRLLSRDLDRANGGMLSRAAE